MLLNKHNLNIHKFCAKDMTRYALRALLVTKNETVATDGHRMVRITTPKTNESLFPSVPDFKADDIEGNLLLHADTAKELVASIPKKKNKDVPVLSTVRIGQENGSLRSVATDLDITHLVQGKKVDGNFPSWRAVIPVKKPTFEIHVSAQYLAELCSFAADVSESGFIRMQFFGADQAMRIDAENITDGQGMTAILMPARCTSKYDSCKFDGESPKRAAEKPDTGEQQASLPE